MLKRSTFGTAGLLAASLLLASHAKGVGVEPPVPPSPPGNVCGDVQSQILWAGQTIPAGAVNIWVQDNNLNGLADTLYVEFDTSTTDWSLTETHVHVGDSLDDIPQTNSGNPKVGLFTYSEEGTDGDSILFVIDLTADPFVGTELDAGIDLFVAAHAVVATTDSGTGETMTETGWADGPGFPGKNWATYVVFTVPDCDTPPPSEVLYRTQTQGGWGTVAKGNNPGTYRDANFDEAFPDGLTIGVLGANSITFATASTIEACLPTGGPAGTLSGGDVAADGTPATCPGTGGVLVGQVTALSLSVGFDACWALGNCDPYDAAQGLLLSDLFMVAANACTGMSVAAILDAANTVLSGDTSQFTPSEINECVSVINENFVDGATDNGALAP